MMTSASLSDSFLLSHIKAALHHYYDSSFLQTSPVGAWAQSERVGGDPVAAIRAFLRQGIDHLKPDVSVPFGRPEWMAHEILVQRYLQLRSIESTRGDLALGRSSYYRYHQQALKALGAWVAAQRDRLPQYNPGSVVSAPPTAVEEMHRLAAQSPREFVDVAALLDEVRSLLMPLLSQKHCRMLIQEPRPCPGVIASCSLLREAFVGLISAALSAGATVDLMAAIECSEGWVRVSLHPIALPGRCERVEECPEIRVARTLLEAYEGGLEVAQGAGGGTDAVCWFPAAEDRHILIIDDSEDSSRLLSTYLSGRHCVVGCVRAEGELDAALAKALPDLILLDILMPDTDGWSILQRLKSYPETRSIPVLVCSVLSQPQLALALGADAVLQKPIGEEELLKAVDAALAPQSGADR